MNRIAKIISGGQTGADRAALDFSLENGIQTGGFVPKGRRAEDGPIPISYPHLTETETRNYAGRTELNVLEADATVILSHGKLTGGSLLTQNLARHHRKPCLHIDLLQMTVGEAAAVAGKWLTENNCRVLNIAGPRSSADPAIYGQTKEFLRRLFRPDARFVP